MFPLLDPKARELSRVGFNDPIKSTAFEESSSSLTGNRLHSTSLFRRKPRLAGELNKHLRYPGSVRFPIKLETFCKSGSRYFWDLVNFSPFREALLLLV
nr:hypothetical protein Iba_chr07bCG3180 [Ipomoea batatas]